MRGSNLPKFRALQYDFAAHIRHPDRNPPPEGIPSRRMDVYVGLVYQNIDNFLGSTFRTARGILSDAHWDAMVRDFVYRHVSHSPYFRQIPEEFLAYLEVERDCAEDPPFLLELCHFEWVRLALDLSDALPLESCPHAPDLDRPLALSPLAWPLRYCFPVHRVRSDCQPATPPEQATWLIGYRDEADRVEFMSSNEATVRLLQILGEAPSAREALHQVAGELARDPERILEFGADIIGRLAALGIVGTPRD
ncbi:MAG: putative DNA-binding domain-containing protein [Gammaproteobacteria bacterium]|nr:putative DNA-binding domain-containing protein [Gammaproteobacteria bacterium]MDE0451220.1 putative DNA-binding domain-containing protein [Gammaproteobacteria bacterium]